MFGGVVMTPDQRAKLHRNIAALRDYQMSLWRINEQSREADREELRVMEQISRLEATLREPG